MKKYQIILIIAGVLVLTGGGWWYLTKTWETPPGRNAGINQQIDGQTEKNWQGLIPEIKKVLTERLFLSSVTAAQKEKELSSVSIYKTGDVNGDGILEALVTFGTKIYPPGPLDVCLFRKHNNTPILMPYTRPTGAGTSALGSALLCSQIIKGGVDNLMKHSDVVSDVIIWPENKEVISVYSYKNTLGELHCETNVYTCGLEGCNWGFGLKSNEEYCAKAGLNL